MAQIVRSKDSMADNSVVDKEFDDSTSIYDDITHRSSRKESPFISLRGQDTESQNHSLIISQRLDLGLIYPSQQLLKVLKLWLFNLDHYLQKFKTTSLVRHLTMIRCF